jgi:hypothetical protein
MQSIRFTPAFTAPVRQVKFAGQNKQEGSLADAAMGDLLEGAGYSSRLVDVRATLTRNAEERGLQVTDETSTEVYNILGNYALGNLAKRIQEAALFLELTGHKN